MTLNPKLSHPITWLWSIDTAFYSLTYPVIQCCVNKQLSVTMYALPALIYCLCGSLLDMRITAASTRAYLYVHWGRCITIGDAVIWTVYFVLWMLGIFPDSWYPVAAAVMSVSTCQLSNAIRDEYKSRAFTDSAELTEFNAAVDILKKLMHAVMAGVLLIAALSFRNAQWIMLLAMTVDNGVFLYLRNKQLKFGQICGII